MNVKVRQIKETFCELYDADGNDVGIISSELELNDVRIQIKEQQLKGYYILWEDENNQKNHIQIDHMGNLERWPYGFFDVGEKQLYKLIGWKK